MVRNQKIFTRPLVKRDLPLHVFPQKATTIIGVRRCGKTTFLRQQIQRILAEGVPPSRICYINFEDDRLESLRQQEAPAVVSEAYYALYPENRDKTVYFLFDEVQMLNSWSRFVSRLLETERCEVFLSGSSAKMLSTEIATEMRGRSFAWELFPFSFKEFLAGRGIETKSNAAIRENSAAIRQAYDRYFQWGGFPEACTEMPDDVRISYLQQLHDTVLLRDILQRHNVGKVEAIMRLSRFLVANCSTSHSVNKLVHRLKSSGVSVSYAQVSDFLLWFCDAYLLFSVPILSLNEQVRRVNPNKWYGIDHALCRALQPSFLPNRGPLLENIVFLALRRLTTEISYFKDESDHEVDFVATIDKQLRLVQVYAELDGDAKTRERETRALQSAMGSLYIKEATIVTDSLQQELSVPEGIIHVVPAWEFLLTLQ